jgi:nucleoid-associated protein YgaU
MSVAITKGSRLNNSTLILVDGVEFWQTPNLVTIPQSTGDLRYTVKQTDRIDSIANNFYGDPDMWWVIARANNIELIPTDLYEGRVLIIPSPNFIKSTLGASVI